MIRQTAGCLSGIPSLVGEGSRFYADDNLFGKVFGMAMSRYKSGGRYGQYRLSCPQCRLLRASVYFVGQGARTRLHHHIEEHYAIRILGRDEVQWAKDCQARQKRLRGVPSE